MRGPGAGGGPIDGTGLIDRQAVAMGAGLGLAVAVPIIVLSSVVGVDSTSNAVFAPFLLYLAGLTLGGRLAARRRPDAPLSNGAVAAIAAYLAIAVVVSVLRLATDRPLDAASLLLNLFLAASAGILGGLIATWRRSDEPGRGQP